MIMVNRNNKFLKKILLLSFLLPLLVSASFSDIDDFKWKNSIMNLETSWIVEGYWDWSYKPLNKINRAEFMKIVIEVFYEGVDESYSGNCFNDVNSDSWYSKYVCFAKEQWIIAWYPNWTFGPSKFITQPEALKIIFNSYWDKVENIWWEWYEQYLNYSEYLWMYYFNKDSFPQWYEIDRWEMAYFVSWINSEDGEVDQIWEDEFYPEEDFDDFESMTKNDCLTWEVYDPGEEICYIECDTDEECSKLEEEILANSEDMYNSWSDSFSDDNLEDIVISSYSISWDDISHLEDSANLDPDLMQFQENTDKHNTIWNYFIKIVPKNARTEISQFNVTTDWKDWTMASVSQVEWDESKWILNIDIQDAFNEDWEMDTKELPYTLIHEFWHVLTLGTKQVDPIYTETEEEINEETQKCYPNFFLQEWCSKSLSYINLFFKKYWKDLYSEWKILNESWEDNDLESISLAFYEKYKSRFVTDYAATNIWEDITESWTAFIFKDKPTWNNIADKKILFFYDFDELVKLRKTIRQRFWN